MVTPLSPIPEGDRARLDAEIAAIQTDLSQARQRLGQLEDQLGYRYGAAPLEARLRAVTERLADPTGLTLPQGQAEISKAKARSQVLSVTLPTDSLFDDTRSSLKPGAADLLADVVTELRLNAAHQTGKASVAIAIHSDDIGSPLTNQELSFRRARVVAQYLADQLGTAYQFVALGYGPTNPLTPNTTNENRRRNRRLEIQVLP
jgi:outer membrane protein OmpA-like peptidoglycan-associated protein